MENLVSRWKSSLNSAKKSQSATGSRAQLQDSQNGSGSGKKQANTSNLSSSSSSEDEFYDRKKFIASLKKFVIYSVDSWEWTGIDWEFIIEA